jgi:predicted nucleic acid-binding protein
LLLDTDILVDLLREHPPATKWAGTLNSLTYLSGIAALEVSFGAGSLQELGRIATLIKTFLVLWPTEQDIIRATTDFSSLRLVHGIGALDSIIAAQSLRVKVPLATFNVKHFQAIPGLVTVQPYER